MFVRNRGISRAQMPLAPSIYAINMQSDSTSSKNTLMLVPFTLGDLRMALSLDAVTQILRSVAVTALPNAPSIVSGVVDIHGAIVPVIDLRRRFRMPERAIEPTDQLLVARMSPAGRSDGEQMTVALLVDSTDSVVEVVREEIVRADSIVAELEHVAGVVRLANGLILIHDLDRCLSLDEVKALDRALESERNA